MLTIEIAGIRIAVDNRYGVLPSLCRDYLTAEPPDFSVSVSDAEIDAEGKGLTGDFTKGELESIAVYRKIAERLSDYSALVFHGVAIELDGEAYLFTAKSGVGKTTHARLWLRRFGDRAKILNGDKPVIRITDGKPYVSGTPWRGKENYGSPGLLPLVGLAFLERSEDNSAEPANAEESMLRFVTQAYIPKSNAARASKAVALISELLSSVPLITLKCNMEMRAADVAYGAFLKARFNKGE